MSWYPQGGDTPAPQGGPPPPPPPQHGDSPAPPPAEGYSGPTQETSSKATIALVVAIGSFLVLGLILAVVALVLAAGAQKEIDASGGQIGGAGRVKAARILAFVNIALSVLVIIVVIVAVAT